jgi:putative copper export protein
MPEDTLASVWLILSRLLWYAGGLGVVGACAFRLVVARSGDRRPRDLERTATAVGLVAGVVLLAGALGRLYAQAYAWFGIDEPITARLLLEVAADMPPWSTGWMAQAFVAVASVAALGAARRGSRLAWMLACLSGVAVAASAPLTGHAVAQPRWYLLPVTLQAVHVLGAGVWIGGLFVMLVVIARRGANDAPRVAAMVHAFSPLALAGAGLVVSAGVATAFLYLDAPGDLWSTTYGRTLLVKTASFAGIAMMGFFNWQHVRPQLRDRAGVALLRRTGTFELVLAALVLGLTAVLVGLPQPGG